MIVLKWWYRVGMNWLGLRARRRELKTGLNALFSFYKICGLRSTDDHKYIPFDSVECTTFITSKLAKVTRGYFWRIHEL